MERAMAEQGRAAGADRIWAPARSRPRIISYSPNRQREPELGVGAALAPRSAGSSATWGGWGEHRPGSICRRGINVKKGEANVTLSLVNARTTEEVALTQGYFRKTDLSWGVGGGAGWWGGFAAAGGSGYQNTEIGQVIVLAYLDAYKKLVT